MEVKQHFIHRFHSKNLFNLLIYWSVIYLLIFLSEVCFSGKPAICSEHLEQTSIVKSSEKGQSPRVFQGELLLWWWLGEGLLYINTYRTVLIFVCRLPDLTGLCWPTVSATQYVGMQGSAKGSKANTSSGQSTTKSVQSKCIDFYTKSSLASVILRYRRAAQLWKKNHDHDYFWSILKSRLLQWLFFKPELALHCPLLVTPYLCNNVHLPLVLHNMVCASIYSGSFI